MAFPEDILPLQVDLSLDGTTWTEVTDDVRHDSRIRITRGRADWGRQTDPGQCTFTLSNQDGRYSPKNPSSPYYGQLGRNTPVRVSVNTGDVALDLPGEAGDYASAPDSAGLDITGDIDVRVDATLVNWCQPDYPSAGQNSFPRTQLIGKSSTGQVSWALYVTGSRPYFEWSTDGSSTSWAWADADLPLTSSGRLALRFTMDVDNGAGGTDVAFYTATSMDGPWVPLESGTVSGTTSLFSSTADLRIGDATGDTRWRPAIGRVHKAEVRSGIDGTIVADPDFTAQTSGATSFADSAGNTWSLGGNAEITNRQVRFVGEISSLSTRWDTGGDDVITQVDASGVLRRLGQGAVPTKSPFYREFTSAGRVEAGIVAYWPMEDGASSTQFSSAVDGHPALVPTGTVTPAAYDGWVASEALPTIGTGSMRVFVPSYEVGSSKISRTGVFVKVPAAGVVSRQRLFSLQVAGSASRWNVEINTSGNLAILAYDIETTLILDTGFGADSINGLEKYLILQLSQSGANVSYNLAVVDIAGSLATAIPDNVSETFTISGTLASHTTGRVTQVRFGEDGAMNGTAVGHLAIGNTSASFTATAGVLVGWNAEEATSRISRIGIEEGLHSYATAGGDEQCGPQPDGTALGIMHDAEGVDEGIVGELRTVLGLRHVTRASLYSQPVTLTLDYEGDDGLVAPLDPVDDDQNVTNDVLVQRTGGASARVTLTDGALSTQAPPDGIGLYDTSYTLNLLDDSQPLQHAAWRLFLSTWDETRYPQVTVDLAAGPSSIDAALLLDTGSRVQITNPPAWLPPDTIDLMVLGYREELDQYTWKIVYNCAPAGPYNVAYEASSAQSLFTHVDTDGSELTEDLDTTETEIDVRVTDGPEWVIASPPFNSNYAFETDLTGWTGNGCTITRVATPDIPPFYSPWSMRLVPDGVAQYPNAGSDMYPVVVGQSYTFSGWQMCETSRSVDLNINWFDTLGAYMTTVPSTEVMTAGEWRWFSAEATAPTGAGFVNISPTVPDFPPSTDVLYSTMLTLRKTVDDELPDDFPFDIRVGGEVMRVTGCTRSAYDSFSIDVPAGSWGTSGNGETWALQGTATDFSVAGGVGIVTPSATDAGRLALITAPSADVDLYVDISTAETPTGAALNAGPAVRTVDTLTYYMCRLDFGTTGSVAATLQKRVGGVSTDLGSYTVPVTHVAGAYLRVRLQVSGSELRARVWPVTRSEPVDWHITATDTDIVAANSVGIRCYASAGNTNANPSLLFDNFKVVNPQVMTVTRSINGVVKTHAAGTDVRLAYPAHASL
ncbi:hypothetical protein ACSLFT_28375 [Streptomyces sp. G6]|uniref:hypothetical protein n=1 Tax=Streptomyces sp. G6 TaxID=1178736 RepID=UPI003ED9458A